MGHRVILCLSVLLLLANPTLAQKHKSTIDSLQQLAHSSPDDTIKALLYGKIAWHYIIDHGNHDSTQLYVDSISQLSLQLGYDKGSMKAYYYQGTLYRVMGMYDEGITYIDKAIEMAKQHSDSLSIAAFSFQKGVMFNYKGEFDLALKALYRSLSIHQESRHDKGMASCLNTIGIIQKEGGEYLKAIATYERVQEICERSGDEMMYANASSNIGSAYFDMGNYNKAEEYFQKTLALDIDLKTDWGIAYQYENLGSVASKKGEHAKAAQLHSSSLKLRKKIGQQREIASTHRAIGAAYLEAESYLIAQSHLDTALHISRSLKARIIEQDVLGLQADLHEKEGRYQAALASHRLYTQLQDSILREERVGALAKLETKFELREKEYAIALLEKDNSLKAEVLLNERRTKKGLLIGLALVLLLGGLAFRAQRQKMKNQRLLAIKNNELRATEYKRTLSDLELKALRAQMNPHFIFNCMNSINRLILEDKNELASRNLTKFSKLIRMILDHSEKKTVKLSEELEMLKTYIELETQRFKGKISYSIVMSEAIDADEVELPSMILQPFIENAIWHGLMHKEGDDGQIDIQIEERGNLLHCVIEDNGVGREKALELRRTSAIAHKSMAMKVTEARLALLNKSGLGRLIEIIDLKESGHAIGTRVKVSIPV